MFTTLLTGCASPALRQMPLVAHPGSEPAAVELADSVFTSQTTVVACRPISQEIDADAVAPGRETVAAHRDPFEQEPLADRQKDAVSREPVQQTVFRDPGLFAPFKIPSVREYATTLEAVSQNLALIPRRMIAASKARRFERALASSDENWCHFRMKPRHEETLLVARANGGDASTDDWDGVDGGYSSPEMGSDGGCDCDGCGIASIDGDCSCCEPRRLSFRQDLYDAFRIGKADFVDLLTVQNAVVLGLAGGAAAIIHRNGDPQVRDWTAEHPDRWGHATNFLGELGNPWVQGGMLTGIYAYGLWTQDEEIHELSLALVGAWKIAAVGTVGLKYAIHTDRPSDDHLHSVWEGGQYGFPSIEASTSFAMAAVFDSFYGLKAGIPAYMLAGLISWSRIDTRDSDLSDVVFGAIFGYVVGKSVAIHHIENAYGFKVQPYTHPISGTPGIALQFAF